MNYDKFADDLAEPRDLDTFATLLARLPSGGWEHMRGVALRILARKGTDEDQDASYSYYARHPELWCAAVVAADQELYG